MECLKQGYHLVWNDEFDYHGQPETSKWNYDLGNHQWANRELQAYTNRPANVIVDNGRLVIKALKEKDGEREYTSTRLVTSGKKSWQYGFFEICAKLPRGNGSWPAIWMLSDAIKNGTPWPKCGEIDIMEHTGRQEDRLLFSLHSDRHNHRRSDTVKYTQVCNISGVCNDFHDYQMEWTPEYIEFLVDGLSICRFNKADDTEDQTDAAWPFDQPFYLIINIAVGGSLGGEVDEAALPYVMEIDHVRVFQKD